MISHKTKQTGVCCKNYKAYNKHEFINFLFLLLIKKIHKNLPPYFIPVYKNELTEYSKQYIIHQTTNKNVLISQVFVFDSTTKTLEVAWHLCCFVVFPTTLTMSSTLPTIPMTTTTIGDRSLKA